MLPKIKDIKKKADKRGPFLARIIFKPLSFLAVKFLANTPIRANHVGLAMVPLSIIPPILFSLGRYWASIGAVAVFFFLLFLDALDGSLARYKDDTSNYGIFLEHIFHNMEVPLIFFALGINSYFYFHNPIFILLGGLTIFAIHIILSSRYAKNEITFKYILKNRVIPLDKIPPDFRAKKKKGLVELVFIFIDIFNDICNLFTILLILALLDLMHYAIFFYAPFYILIAIAKLILELKTGFKEFGIK